MNPSRIFPASLCLSAVVCTAAQAGVTISIAEVGQDVVITTAGSLDLSSWESLGQIGGDLAPSIGSSRIFLGPEALNTNIYVAPDSFSGPSSIDSTGAFGAMSTGDTFGFEFSSGAIYLPNGFSPGSDISAVDVYQNQSFSSMGLIDGASYTWTWETFKGDQDFVTLTVPTPASCVTVGLACLAATRRRR